MSDAAVLLVNPKTPYNVGAVIRSMAIFGGRHVVWTGDRIDDADARREAGSNGRKDRLPREERMKEFSDILWGPSLHDRPIAPFTQQGYTPVAVEYDPNFERLSDFVHPEKALYVFGPEDGSLGGSWLAACHRFVRIPTATRTPLNLAQAVNLVLYDRFIKTGVDLLWDEARQGRLAAT